MKNWTIYASESEGRLGGIGFCFAPDGHEINRATVSYCFRRGDTRIYVLVITGFMTEEQARQLALNLYEGRTIKANFNDDTARIGSAAIRGELQFS